MKIEIILLIAIASVFLVDYFVRKRKKASTNEIVISKNIGDFNKKKYILIGLILIFISATAYTTLILPDEIEKKIEGFIKEKNFDDAISQIDKVSILPFKKIQILRKNLYWNYLKYLNSRETQATKKSSTQTLLALELNQKIIDENLFINSSEEIKLRLSLAYNTFILNFQKYQNLSVDGWGTFANDSLQKIFQKQIDKILSIDDDHIYTNYLAGYALGNLDYWNKILDTKPSLSEKYDRIIGRENKDILDPFIKHDTGILIVNAYLYEKSESIYESMVTNLLNSRNFYTRSNVLTNIKSERDNSKYLNFANRIKDEINYDLAINLVTANYKHGEGFYPESYFSFDFLKSGSNRNQNTTNNLPVGLSQEHPIQKLFYKWNDIDENINGLLYVNYYWIKYLIYSDTFSYKNGKYVNNARNGVFGGAKDKNTALKCLNKIINYDFKKYKNLQNIILSRAYYERADFKRHHFSDYRGAIEDLDLAIKYSGYEQYGKDKFEFNFEVDGLKEYVRYSCLIDYSILLSDRGFYKMNMRPYGDKFGACDDNKKAGELNGDFYQYYVEECN